MPVTTAQTRQELRRFLERGVQTPDFIADLHSDQPLSFHVENAMAHEIPISRTSGSPYREGQRHAKGGTWIELELEASRIYKQQATSLERSVRNQFVCSGPTMVHSRCSTVALTWAFRFISGRLTTDCSSAIGIMRSSSSPPTAPA